MVRRLSIITCITRQSTDNDRVHYDVSFVTVTRYKNPGLCEVMIISLYHFETRNSELALSRKLL